MYVPKHFRGPEVESALHDVIAAHPFAVLIVAVDGGVEAQHMPVVVDPSRGAHGSIRFHLAKPNPAVAALDGTREALLVFTGPNTYVSPDWYETPHMVPTWNYVAVHAYGRPAPMDDEALCRLLDDLSATMEGGLPKKPWTTDKVPADAYAAMRRGIVGFDVAVERIEGKWKLNQNRSEGDRAGVIAELERLGGDQRLAVAGAMRALDGG